MPSVWISDAAGGYRFRKARTLSAILDTYNSGNWRDVHVPLKYIRDGINYYQNLPLP